MSGTSVVRSPIDGSQIAEVRDATPAELDQALDAAVAAQRAWAATPATTRGRVLAAVGDAIEARVDELSALETRNTGKIPTDTRREVLRAAGSFRYYGGWADKHTGDTIPVGPDHHTYTVPVPHGVVLGIVPWNVPFFFAAKKIAPALAFGNAVVLKPAAETPLTALELGRLLTDAGVPEGLVRVLPGGGDVGAALVADRRVDLIVFTGHHETGKRIARSAADNLTPVALELGGKSPQIVFGDADLDAAVDAVALGVFASAGQMCIAGSRLLVHESVHDAVVGALADRVRTMRVGDPFAPGVELGPQITATQQAKTMELIESARGAATVLAQSALPTDPALAGGFFVPPTIVTDVASDARVLREEVFGPVLTVDTFVDEDEAVAKAMDTEFGLAAGVWTESLSRAHRMAAALDVGTVWLNTYRVLSDLVPFGGAGMSGYGRENGEEAARLYTRAKSVWTALRTGPPAGYAPPGSGPGRG